MRITARMFACIGLLMAVCLMAPGISFASSVDTSVAYGLHVVSVDVDVGKYLTASEVKHENKNMVDQSVGGDDAKRRSIGVSYLIENAGIADKAFTKLDIAKARGPPLLC